MSTRPTEKPDKFILDKSLFFILILFMLTSLVAIYASGPHVGGDATHYVIYQALFYVISFVALFVICYLGIDRIFGAVKIVYWILLAMMILLLVDKYGLFSVPFVRPVNNTWAWYHFPYFSFQPSEFMKIVLVLITAGVIDKHNKEKRSLSMSEDFKLYFKIALYLLPVLVLNYLQPDTGVPLIMVISILVMVLVSGVNKMWFIIVLLGALIGYFGIIYVYYNHVDVLVDIFGSSYRLDRFYAWLDYEKYSQYQGYQLYRSIISLGSAGMNGLGLEGSVVYIPAAHTDFIFAVFGSTFGFMGSLYIIALCFALDVKLIMIAIRSRNMIGRYAIAGIVGIFVYQQVQNIGMMIGLLPITGITLPLLSYGGSSLLSYMIALSVPFSVSSETVNHPHYEATQVPLPDLE